MLITCECSLESVCYIDALASVYIHRDIGSGELGESGRFDGYRIAADFNIKEVVIAVFVRSGFRLNPRLLLQQRNSCLRDGAAGVVADRAQHFAGFEVRPQSGAQEKERNEAEAPGFCNFPRSRQRYVTEA